MKPKTQKKKERKKEGERENDFIWLDEDKTQYIIIIICFLFDQEFEIKTKYNTTHRYKTEEKRREEKKQSLVCSP